MASLFPASIKEISLPSYKIVEIHSKEEAIKHGKHCGWCTGKIDNLYYEEVYQFGRLFVLYKDNKRRPSYQLFVRDDHTEFRKKGNKPLNPWHFAEKNSQIKAELLTLLPEENLLENLVNRTITLAAQRVVDAITSNLIRPDEVDLFVLQDRISTVNAMFADEEMRSIRTTESYRVWGEPRTIGSLDSLLIESPAPTPSPRLYSSPKKDQRNPSALDRLQQRNKALDGRAALFSRMKITLPKD